MTTLATLASSDVATKLGAGDIRLIDIRDADEFAREHIEGAISLPLSTWRSEAPGFKGDLPTVFMCRSGMRTESNREQLALHAANDAHMLEGGLDAWKKQGLPTIIDAKAPIEIIRQVHITAGSLILAGAVLATLVHPGFLGLSAFVGAGLLFAGVSGFCGMAHLLRAMPWNKAEAASSV